MKEKCRLSDSPHTYWFHLHTHYTDGVLSVEDYFKMAKIRGIEELIFLEHIRRKPSYDVEEFVEIVKNNAKKYQIHSRVGFEAKIIEDGTLDISDEHLELSEIIGIAEHGFPSNSALFLSAWKKAMDFAKDLLPKKEVVWVHPGLFFRKNRLLISHQQEYHHMLNYALDQGIQLEYNLKYKLFETPNHQKIPYVLGIDAHRESDIRLWEKYLKLNLGCVQYSDA